jgi:Uma2 family endonuclease
MAVTGQLTLDEFLRLPEEKPALEYAQGVVSQKMPPMGWHSKLQGELYFRFRMHGYPRRLVSAFSEARVTWPEVRRSFVPDVIAYRVEREPTDPNGLIADHLTVPPDVAVEIWSAGQVLSAQMDRCRWYIAHDVPISLLLHPERRTVWTFRPGVESGPLQAARVVDLSDVFEGLSFSVAELFEALRPGSG